MREHDLQPFRRLISAEAFDLLIARAPTKVRTRIAKACEHFAKATTHINGDEEAGALRLIAAEEELVVAIFEWLKLNAAVVPDHADFVVKRKNHLVKLAFHPVMSQIVWVLRGLLQEGLTIEARDDDIHLSLCATCREDRVSLRLEDSRRGISIDVSPLDFSIALEGKSDEQVIDSLYNRFGQTVAAQLNMSVREFITTRANFRNQILYAEDGHIFSMKESLDGLISDVFSPALRDLLWALSILLTNAPTARDWGLVNQVISLYRRALIESRLV